MKKIILFLFITLLVGCDSKIDVDSSIVYLSDPSKEEAYNEYIKEALKNDKDIALVETETLDEYIKMTKDLSGDNVDLIISTDSIVNLSKDNGINIRKQKVASLSNSYDTKYLDENIMQVTYKVNNAGFLAGAASGYYALANGQRQVGFIITDDSKVTHKLLAGFEDGVWEEFPECNIYLGSTLNGASLSSIIDQMADNGVQLIFTSTAFGDTSVIDEIAKRKESGSNLLALNYDCFKRDIGSYKKLIADSDSDSENEEYEIKNCIYYRIYEDASTSLNFIKNHFNDEKTNSGVAASEVCFIDEVLNGFENIDENMLFEKLEAYKNKLNTYEIIVRSTPSNNNVESRMKIVE